MNQENTQDIEFFGTLHDIANDIKVKANSRRLKPDTQKFLRDTALYLQKVVVFKQEELNEKPPVFTLSWDLDWFMDQDLTKEEATDIISDLNHMDTISTQEDILDSIEEWREKNPKKFVPHYCTGEITVPESPIARGPKGGVNLYAHVTPEHKEWIGTFPLEADADKYLKGLSATTTPVDTFNVWWEVKILEFEGCVVGAVKEVETLVEALELARLDRDNLIDYWTPSHKISIEMWHNARGLSYPTYHHSDIVRTLEQNLEHWNAEEAKNED